MKMQWGGLALLAMSTVLMATQDVKVEATRVSGSLSVDILATGAAKTITYCDGNGKPISKQAFLAAIQRGGKFIYKRDEARASTVFTLTSPDAHSNPEVAVALNNSLHEKYRVSHGQKFPDFTLATLDGDIVSAASSNGRPTLIQFFFANCTSCFVDNPALNAFARTHPDVRVLAMTSDDAQDASAYAEQHALAWPVAYAGQKVFDALGVKVFPALALVSADGRLLDLRVSGRIAGRDGRVSEEDLERWVREGLSGQGDGRSPVSANAVPAKTATPTD